MNRLPRIFSFSAPAKEAFESVEKSLVLFVLLGLYFVSLGVVFGHTWADTVEGYKDYSEKRLSPIIGRR